MSEHVYFQFAVEFYDDNGLNNNDMFNGADGFNDDNRLNDCTHQTRREFYHASVACVGICTAARKCLGWCCCARWLSVDDIGTTIRPSLSDYLCLVDDNVPREGTNGRPIRRVLVPATTSDISMHSPLSAPFPAVFNTLVSIRWLRRRVARVRSPVPPSIPFVTFSIAKYPVCTIATIDSSPGRHTRATLPSSLLSTPLILRLARTSMDKCWEYGCLAFTRDVWDVVLARRVLVPFGFAPVGNDAALDAEDSWHMSTHNVRIERLWVDIQKDALEAFRQIFLYLEQNGLWEKENALHCICLFLVFQPRIQAALNRAKHAWNHHKIRTARNQTPVAMYALSRQKLMNQGVWTGDVGDDVSCVDGFYGVEGAEDEGLAMPSVDPNDPNSALAEDADIEAARQALGDFDFEEEDGNWGIDVYCKAVIQLHACIS
ncbi:hypothetical protein BDZ89DRAFT_1129461 [Hymenopellis radicata]|nr:hypothetical protein BDZ89DRAFT_1129461 [Hymenopellis radicata]